MSLAKISFKKHVIGLAGGQIAVDDGCKVIFDCLRVAGVCQEFIVFVLQVEIQSIADDDVFVSRLLDYGFSFRDGGKFADQEKNFVFVAREQTPSAKTQQIVKVMQNHLKSIRG